MNKTNLIFTLVFAAAVAYAVRSLLPIREEIIIRQPPITIYDTVKTLDTVWINRIKRDVDTLWLERFTITEPETVFVRSPVIGMKALFIPEHVGDTMYAFGFRLAPDPDSIGYFIDQSWMSRWVIPGPPKGIMLDDDLPPRAAFYDPPKPRRDCGLFCKASHYLVGGAGGYALCRVGV